MNATPALYALGTCLLAAAGIAAATVSPSWFEARTSGAAALTLGGSAEFGRVTEADGGGRFVLTLGAASPSGAVIFTRPAASRPEPGTYRLDGEAPGAIRALVVTGAPDRPTGAFRARAGTLTITTSRDDLIAGRFEIDARGYEAADPADEDRALRVRGAFTATPSR
jgi:hypothetical protein